MRYPKNWPAGIPKPPPLPKRWLEDEQWFMEHSSELAQQHPDQWVAVFDKQVIAAGKMPARPCKRRRRKQVGKRSLLTWFRRPERFIRINIAFHEDLDLPLILEGIEVRIIRLDARVRFKVDGQWTDLFRAIIDPGSPNCLIPHFIWSAVDHRILVSRPLRLGGIGGGLIAAPFGVVTLVVKDGITTSPPLTIRVFLLPDDSEPLLLGFADFLTRSILHCDYPQREAYSEFRLQ